LITVSWPRKDPPLCSSRLIQFLLRAPYSSWEVRSLLKILHFLGSVPLRKRSFLNARPSGPGGDGLSSVLLSQTDLLADICFSPVPLPPELTLFFDVEKLLEVVRLSQSPRGRSFHVLSRFVRFGLFESFSRSLTVVSLLFRFPRRPDSPYP